MCNILDIENSFLAASFMVQDHVLDIFLLRIIYLLNVYDGMGIYYCITESVTLIQIYWVMLSNDING